LAVLEQILPLFRPEYTLTINAVPEMNVSVDIPIELQGVSISDDYEGDFATRRFVIHTFEFTAKIKLFGPVINSGLIYRTESTIESPFNTEHVAQADPNTGNIILDQWSQI
jgi:hypothetical protein